MQFCPKEVISVHSFTLYGNGTLYENWLLTPSHAIPIFETLKKPFENIVEKRENAGDQHFLIFHNVFSPIEDRNQHFSNI